jgi:hypothetical protein
VARLIPQRYAGLCIAKAVYPRWGERALKARIRLETTTIHDIYQTDGQIG